MSAAESLPESSGRPVVLLPGPMTDHVVEACSDRFDAIRLWEESDPDGVLLRRGAEITGVATAGRPAMNAEFMARLPNLRIVAGFGVGYDSIDVQEAARRGIVVTNTPDVLTDDVADIAIGLLLMVVRELPQSERYLREGRWRADGPFRLAPTTMRGRRLGVLGLGRIGVAVAERAQAFGLEVSYHNRRRKEVAYRYFETLPALAEHVDTLVIATPGGAGTHHLVDADVLRRLGPEGIVVNVARGSVVDQQALADALREGTILGAGLDVYENEPDVPGELLDLSNAVLLPHIGSASTRTRRAMGQLVVDNLASWFETGAALTPVPETAGEGVTHA